MVQNIRQKNHKVWNIDGLIHETMSILPLFDIDLSTFNITKYTWDLTYSAICSFLQIFNVLAHWFKID